MKGTCRTSRWVSTSISSQWAVLVTEVRNMISSRLAVSAAIAHSFRQPAVDMFAQGGLVPSCAMSNVEMSYSPHRTTQRIDIALRIKACCA